MSLRNRISLALLCVGLLGSTTVRLCAQGSVGLYKDGRLVDSFTLTPDLPSARRLHQATSNTSTPVLPVPDVLSETSRLRSEAFEAAAAATRRIGDRLRSARPAESSPALALLGLDAPILDLEALTAELQDLEQAHAQARAAFDEIGNEVLAAALDPIIYQRHLDAVTAFETGHAHFVAAVNNVQLASPGALDDTLALLDQLHVSQQPDLTKVGPTHTPMDILAAPELTREEADALLEARPGQPRARASQAPAGIAPAGTGDVATPDDLAETPDIELHSEIRAKATTLGSSPYAIYNFVKNQVSFQPYLGSRKGALNTLRQRAGNDTDQASLLMALLRAAGFPCRYVRGTVEMTPQQATSWLGVDDAGVAGNILTTAGLDGINIMSGGQVVAIRCTRVWVEAYLPYGNYRGVPNDDTGKTWIPLDPAFKGTVVTPGEDVLAAMGYNNDAFLANYISTYNSNSPIEQLELNTQAWLDANRPGKKVDDIARTVAARTEDLGLLPASLPVKLLSASSPFPALSDRDRYKVRFRLYNGGTTFIDFTTNLSALAGHQVTINYVGATPADQAAIDARGGIYQTPPYLVRVKPVLKADGIPVAASTNAIGMGYTHSSDMHFIAPVGAGNVQPVVSNDITAGNSQAIAFDTFLDTPALFLASTNPTPDSFLLNLLHTTAVDYLSRVDRGEERASLLLRTVHTVDVSEAIVESSVAVTYDVWSGSPQSFKWTGLIVDADRRIVGPFGANGETSKKLPFMLLTGYDGSFMENDVFEDMYAQRAVSTVRILQLSRDMGIPTCYITNTIASECPGFNHSSSVRSAVNNALARGHVVIIPQREIKVGQWSGTGYIDLNPATGAAGYIISGGISGSISVSGGATVDVWPIYLGCSPVGSITGTITPNGFSTGQILCPDGSHIRYTVELRYNCMDAQGNIQPKTFPPTSHTVPKSNEEIVRQYGAGVYTISIPGTSVTPVTFTLVDLISLTPDKGLEVDDQDGNSDTKAYVVCKDDPVTVTAVSAPGLAEAAMPPCWSLSGGNGSGRLSRTVTTSAAGTTHQVQLTCGSRQKRVTIYVPQIRINLAVARACDGDSVNLDVDVLPTLLQSHINEVKLNAVKPGGATDFANPASHGLSFSKRGTALHHRIDNVRWYSTQADHCNRTSDYEIRALVQFGGFWTFGGLECASEPASFTADSGVGTCFSGSASIIAIWTGTPAYTTTFNPGSSLYETTIAAGTFHRAVRASSTWTAPADSQFAADLRAEEEFHEQQQMENANHVRWGTAFRAANVLSAAQNNQPYRAATQHQSRLAAVQAFQAAQQAEEQRSITYLNQQSVICDDESEAKQHLGWVYRFTLKCAYPSCP